MSKNNSPWKSKKQLLDIESPKVRFFGNGNFGRRIRAKDALAKRVQKVSQRAALVGKQKIWDSNDASIDAAHKVVDQWENAYTAFKTLLINTSKSALDLYGTAKSGAHRIEHSLLVPVRDVVILPTFAGVEKITSSTIQFLQSERACQVASSTMQIVRQTPFIGETIVAPAIVHTFYFLKNTWDIIQYPIPSRETVRYVVDTSLTSMKWAISTTGKEIYFYMKLVDATITRTLMHTQWRILGSGPYGNLIAEHKEEIINHVCERYLSYPDPVSRYELVTHIKRQNRTLYDDLIKSGLLQSRGGVNTIHDIWLDISPIYRSMHSAPLLIPRDTSTTTEGVSPLWFYNTSRFTDKITKDPYWICFHERDRNNLENKFFQSLLKNEEQHHDLSPNAIFPNEEFTTFSDNTTKDFHHKSYPTFAKWYEPDIVSDVLVEHNRFSVTFTSKLLVTETFTSMEPFIFHPLSFLMRPNLWRYYGEGNDVRRGTWFLDSQRHGLQPYSDESAAVLEDAYLFLCWLNTSEKVGNHEIDNILLTVCVLSPDDGEEQLVQFRSLKQITAIPKSLPSGFSIFKRRVYRGAVSNQVKEVISCPKSASNIDRELAAPNELVPKSTVFELDFDQATHLVLVVHGIGETMRSIGSGEICGLTLPPALTATLIDNVDCLRRNHGEILSTYHVNHNGDSNSNFLGRVEYLPIEWHEAFTIQSRRSPTSASDDEVDHYLHEISEFTTMSDISLMSIKETRNLVNNTMMDILYYMSPIHRGTMIDIVVREMNVVVEKFKRLTNFNGKISILAHSLGSIVTWDILLNHFGYKVSDEFPRTRLTHDLSPYDGDLYSNYKSNPSSTEEGHSASKIEFPVDNAFMIGSPIAVFLMLRNISISDTFILPGCSRVFNVSDSFQ